MQCARRGCDSQSPYITRYKPLCYTHWKEWDEDDPEVGIIECDRCHWFSSYYEQQEYWDYHDLLEKDQQDIAHSRELAISPRPYDPDDVPSKPLCDQCLVKTILERNLPMPYSLASAYGRKMGIDSKGIHHIWNPPSSDIPEQTPHIHEPMELRVRYVYILKRDDGTFYVGQTIDLHLRYQEHRDGTHASTKGTNPQLVYYEKFYGQRDAASEREDHLTLQALNGLGRRRIREMIERFRTDLRLVNFDA